MIRFTRDSWWEQVTHLSGGVLPEIWGVVLFYAMYSATIYIVLLWLEINVIVCNLFSSLKLLFCFVSYLMVMRLNQCYTRYEVAKLDTTLFFSALHQINCIACGYLLALAKEEPNLEASKVRQAIAFRIHVVRLTLAIGVAFKYHCRLAETALTAGQIDGDGRLILFDYLRLSGLLYAPEQRIIDAAAGIFTEVPPDLDNLVIRDLINIRYLDEHTAGLYPLFGNTGARHSRGSSLPMYLLAMLRVHATVPLMKPWGYPDRMLGVIEPWLAEVALRLERLETVVAMPMPLAFLQYGKIIVLIFFVIYPFAVKTSDGVFGNIVFPVLLFSALLGFETLADLLENPLGDDKTDLNILEMLHDLEVRAAEVFCLTTDHWWRWAAVVRSPHAAMPLPGDKPITVAKQAEFQEMCGQWGFSHHFAWMPLPNVVTVSMRLQNSGSTEHLGEEEEDGPLPHQRLPTFNPSDPLEITNFLCLQSRRVALHKTLNVYAASNSDQLRELVEAISGEPLTLAPTFNMGC